MKIFVWCNSCAPEWHSITAMDENGVGLAGHVCSDHGFIRHDMGFDSDWKHDTYDKAHPDGWELEFVEDPKAHVGLMAAYAKTHPKE